MSEITCMSVYTERSAADLVAFAHCPTSMGVRPPTRDATIARPTVIGRRSGVEPPPGLPEPPPSSLALESFPARRTAVSAHHPPPPLQLPPLSPIVCSLLPSLSFDLAVGLPGVPGDQSVVCQATRFPPWCLWLSFESKTAAMHPHDNQAV